MSSYQLIREPIVVDKRMERMIAGAVAEVDREQIAIYRKMTPAQRCRQAISMIKCCEKVAVYRLQQEKPDLGETEAFIEIRSRARKLKELSKQWKRKI